MICSANRTESSRRMMGMRRNQGKLAELHVWEVTVSHPMHCGSIVGRRMRLAGVQNQLLSRPAVDQLWLANVGRLLRQALSSVELYAARSVIGDGR